MERVLPSLAPNTTYVARVRSYNNLGVASTWSEALSFTTQPLPINPGGGVGSFPTHTGTGTPEGVLTSDPGKSYQDTDTGALYLKATGIGATGWVVIAGAAVDSIISPPISGIYELPVGPFAGTALVGDAAVVSGQEIVLIEVGAPTINGTAKALVALVTGPSGSNTLSEVAIGAGDGSLTISDLANGTTPISSTIAIQTTAPTGGVQMSGPNLALTATTGGIEFTSSGYGPVSLFAYSGNPNTNVTAITKGDLCVDTTTPGLWQASGAGTAGWVVLGSGSGSGTINSVSIASSNGFTGSSSGGANPILTLATSINGLLKGSSGVLAAANASDIPTLNQDTTGAAGKLTTSTPGIQVTVSSASAPISGQVLTATSGTSATWQTPASGTSIPTTSNLIKGNGSGGLTAGSPGTDYIIPGGALGTPSSGTLTNATGLPVAGVIGAQAGPLTGDVTTVGTAVTLATGIVAAGSTNAPASITVDTKGRVTAVGAATTPVLSGGALGTPSSGTLTNATGLPVAGVIGAQAGPLTGDVTTSGAAATLTASGVTGYNTPVGSTTTVPVITYDAKGRLTTVTTATIASGSQWCIANVNNLTYQNINRNSNGATISATVTWPDGTYGAYTADTLSTTFPGAVDGYHVTWLGSTIHTVTQPTITRDNTGAVINQPALTYT